MTPITPPRDGCLSASYKWVILMFLIFGPSIGAVLTYVILRLLGV